MREIQTILLIKNPVNIHLILDGGALNGLFELGSLLYSKKELERNNYINVSKNYYKYRFSWTPLFNR